MLARKPRKSDYYHLRPLKIPQKYKMGCASSQAAQAKGTLSNLDSTTSTTTESAEPGKYPPAEAFEIPLDDEGEKVDSIIKKHPPKRLQRLTDTPAAPTTIEDLEEKLAKAKIRRQQYLQQKVEGVVSLTKGRDTDEEGEDATEERGQHKDEDVPHSPDNDQNNQKEQKAPGEHPLPPLLPSRRAENEPEISNKGLHDGM